MKTCFILTLLVISASLKVETNQYKSTRLSKQLAGDSTGTTLIINAVDVDGKKFRKNKTALFHQLVDTLRYMIKERLETVTGGRVIIATQMLVSTGQGDSMVYKLLQEYKATRAIMIKEYDVHFEQKEVEVTTDESGKHRNANYDIYTAITYSCFNNMNMLKESSVVTFHHFSTRSVMSGLFAAGPNIVNNKDAAIDISRENVAEYFSNYYPYL